MAVPGPTDRTFTIDDNGGTARDMTDLIVGEPGGIGEIEESLTDFTGAGSTTPVILPAGFSRATDLTFVFQADVGGSSPVDPTTVFHVNRGTSRTITVTYASGWTWSSEAYISKVTPKTPVEGLSTLEVTFKPTGAITVT